MKFFLFVYFLAFLVHVSIVSTKKPTNKESKNESEKRNTIVNKFNFAFGNDKRTVPILRQQEAWRIFKEMERENKLRRKQELENQIYRKYLNGRIRSSIANDFLTMRY
jgi:hypothetical protein